MSLSNTERSGLSPLARGTLCYPLKTADSRRFIPAGAGNTLLPAQNRRFASVYPRWRGEHFATRSKPPIRVGLSPLARGTLCYAAQNRRFASVYPRWRGEHSASVQAGTRYSGLSPLARGTLCYPLKTADSRRFIPAGAGNTRPASRLAPDIPVYPRWRGEHSINCGGSEANSGLSPLARGTHTAANYGSRNARFIPAGAGNTSRQRRGGPR